MSETIILTFVGLFVFQQVFWMRQIQKLIDKVMSKSYSEYALTKAQGERSGPQEMKIKVDNEPSEDLSRIGGFV